MLWLLPQTNHGDTVGSLGNPAKQLGERGLICPDRMPIPGDLFTDGNVGYHLRDNLHYLSREDWNAYIKFLNVKFK